MARPLTQRQSEVLCFIARHGADHGRPPTVREIAEAFGFRSVYAATCVIEALEQKACLTRTPMKSRGLALTDAAKAFVAKRLQPESERSHEGPNPIDQTGDIPG